MFCHLLRKISWLYRFQSPKIKQKHLIPHNKYRSTAGSCLQDQLIHDYQRNLTSLWLRKKFVCVLISSFNKFIGVWLEVKGWFVPSKKLFVYGLVLHWNHIIFLTIEKMIASPSKNKKHPLRSILEKKVFFFACWRRHFNKFPVLEEQLKMPGEHFLSRLYIYFLKGKFTSPARFGMP